jgi:hypothetical protein
MATRDIRLHSFCSVKGGVGKSTLAVACAQHLAASGRVPVLIDADLTGTSLADGLNLIAPRVALGEGGTMDLSQVLRAGFHTSSETRALRSARRGTAQREPAPPPPYLNDVLVYDPEIRAEAALWRAAQPDGVLYMPSSALDDDVNAALHWLHGPRPFEWVQRFTWLLDGLLCVLPTVTDFVIDLPPGVWGFTHELMVLISTLSASKPLPAEYPDWSRLRWHVNPFLVLTSDSNGLLPSLEYFARTLLRVPNLRPLLNRRTEAAESVRTRARRLLGPPLSDLGTEQRLVFIDEDPEQLGQLFKTTTKTTEGPRPEWKQLAPALRLEVTGV